MFKNMKLGTKLILAFLCVGVIPFAVIGITSLNKSSDALSKQAYGQLAGVRGIKKAQIQNFFGERQGDIGVLVETVGTLRKEAFAKLVSVREIKKTQIENFFAERQGDMGVLVETVANQITNKAEANLQTKTQAKSIIKSEAEAVYKFLNSWSGDEEKLKDVIAEIEVGKTRYIWVVDYAGNYVV